MGLNAASETDRVHFDNMGYSMEVIYSSSDQNDDSTQECFSEFYFAFCGVCIKCFFYDELMRRLSSTQFGI